MMVIKNVRASSSQNQKCTFLGKNRKMKYNSNFVQNHSVWTLFSESTQNLGSLGMLDVCFDKKQGELQLKMCDFLIIEFLQKVVKITLSPSYEVLRACLALKSYFRG